MKENKSFISHECTNNYSIREFVAIFLILIKSIDVVFDSH